MKMYISADRGVRKDVLSRFQVVVSTCSSRYLSVVLIRGRRRRIWRLLWLFAVMLICVSMR